MGVKLLFVQEWPNVWRIVAEDLAPYPTDSCQVVVDATGICGAQDIVYTCDDGAELILLQNGLLLVPDGCDGACGVGG